jgi:adenosylcobinamide kinase/adenosylcobinamide-phosphate guanylyltransferase
MAQRIAFHQQSRPSSWALVEETQHLARTLKQHAAPERFLLVDCLTLWLTNLLFQGKAAAQADAGEPIDCPLLAAETAALFEVLPHLPGHIVLVSNEVGLGIVPLGASTRLFVDEAGRLNQKIAALAQQVSFVAAGLPLVLKSSS